MKPWFSVESSHQDEQGRVSNLWAQNLPRVPKHFKKSLR